MVGRNCKEEPGKRLVCNPTVKRQSKTSDFFLQRLQRLWCYFQLESAGGLFNGYVELGPREDANTTEKGKREKKGEGIEFFFPSFKEEGACSI